MAGDLFFFKIMETERVIIEAVSAIRSFFYFCISISLLEFFASYNLLSKSRIKSGCFKLLLWYVATVFVCNITAASHILLSLLIQISE